jgi:hypothetical protein
MQEEQTFTFSPMEFYVPWYVSLFRFFLIVVMLLATIRFAGVLWALRKKRIGEQTEPLVGLELSEYWERCYIKARSFKTLSLLTFLVAITDFVWTLSGDLMQVATQKTSGVGAIAGSSADALRTLALGGIVSTILFCYAAFCERLIHGHRLGWTRV